MSEAIQYSGSEMAKRVPLAEVVPLDKPFSVQILVSAVCNLDCEFCPIQNTAHQMRIRESCNNGVMDLPRFKCIVDNIKESFGKIKQIILTGNGEPLLNPNIVDMISYAVSQNVSERIDIVTNGLLLTHELADRLIDSGLTYLRISINGLSSEDYLKYCGRKINFEQYVDQIRYFFERKKNTILYLKIMSYMVRGQEEKERFFSLFQPISDIINIEYVLEMGDNVSYRNFLTVDEIKTSARYSDHRINTSICSLPFYLLIVAENGSVYPCCEGMLANNFRPFGNALETSLLVIWRKCSIAFQRIMLNGSTKVTVCSKCKTMMGRVLPEDVLDQDAERLKAKYDTIDCQGCGI